VSSHSGLENLTVRPTRRWNDLRVAGPLFVALILLGIFVPYPKHISGLWAFSFLWFGAAAAEEQAVQWCSTLLILIPSALFLLGLYRFGQRKRLITIRRICVFFLVIAFVDLPLTFLVGIFGTEASLLIQIGVALSVAAANIFFVCALHQLEHGKTTIPIGSALGGSPAICLATWSLLQVPVVLAQATYLAGGRPFCIADTGAVKHNYYAPVRSVFDLRGTNFYTGVTGYKDSSRWAFHGVLIVRDQLIGDEYWNWSISRMRFEPRPGSTPYVIDWRRACTPEPNALFRLRWY
jgi:hypothetical protein